jgi:hypothetical protein
MKTFRIVCLAFAGLAGVITLATAIKSIGDDNKWLS